MSDSPVGDPELETLRDAFIDAFNARDLDELVALVDIGVEVPDVHDGDGVDALSEEVERIWERSPGVILTRAFLEDRPCAVGWTPDGAGGWARVALVTFDREDELLSLVGLPDDPDALAAAEAEEPAGDELEEWSDPATWDEGGGPAGP